MQQVTCPGCGAPVEFKSAASVLAVCEFCKTTLLKEADAVRDLGKMSAVLEDFSPLQIGTCGQYAQRAFSLVGRIQLRYSDGFWNEWYALFDDGSNGWLSDGSGQYTLTTARRADVSLPLFEKLVPGHVLHLGGQAFVAADVRTAQCTGGQGELPFKVGAGYTTRVADFRSGERFLTLDYGHADQVRVYVGQAVRLEELKPQLLRDAADVNETAGEFHGKVSALNCPACGAAVKCAPGFTVHLVCPSCHAVVDTAGDVATILARGAAVEAVKFSLELGSEATVDGSRFTILGAMRRADAAAGLAGSNWSEYLLYAPGRKFLWLVETEEGWQRTEVLDRWPGWDGSGRAMLDGVMFRQVSQYPARVVFAVGAFNWRVAVGDLVQVSEYSAGQMRLAAEVTTTEMTWSRSLPAPLDQVRAWFGGHVHVAQQPHPKYMDSARRILIALLIINAIPLLFATANALTYALLGAAAIYLPAFFLDKLDVEGR